MSNCPDSEDGLRMVCIDDICRGLGECMYIAGGRPVPRDGQCYVACYTCKGEGYVDWEDEPDYADEEP